MDLQYPEFEYHAKAMQPWLIDKLPLLERVQFALFVVLLVCMAEV